MNKHGSITIEATRIGKDTALSNIIQTVEAAQSSKAPIQRLADIIFDKAVSLPILVASIVMEPCLFIVAPMTVSFTFFSIGIDSPVSID